MSREAMEKALALPACERLRDFAEVGPAQRAALEAFAAALRAALAAPQEPVAWLLPAKRVNNLQVQSIQRLIDRAKQAHYVDLKIRIYGRDEHYEADWLKHLTRAVPAAQPGQVVVPDEVTRTAPERIWLQVSDESIDCDQKFPADPDGISWCAESVTACEVEYVRADLAAAQEPVARALEILCAQCGNPSMNAAPICYGCANKATPAAQEGKL